MTRDPKNIGMTGVQQKTEGCLLSEGARIYYEVYGTVTSTTMVMLHGNMQNARYFKKQIEFFKAYYQIITIDSRGHGKSEFGHLRLSLEVLAEDVIKILDTLNVTQAIILGFSDGGNIAVKIAQRIPKRLVAVIAVGSNLSPLGLKPVLRFPVQLLFFIAKGLGRINWFDRKAQKLALMIHEPNIHESQLNQIFVPVLVLSGQFDVIHRQHTKIIAKELPISEWVVLKHSGHNLLRWKARKANQIILNFLETIERDSDG